ncbi:hypothetical protein FPHOBKDP_00066 [Listeria phage LPJP1]|nr:hypothetical protein FPHOBKDP_00066 [Listeria phage LPJP1]
MIKKLSKDQIQEKEYLRNIIMKNPELSVNELSEKIYYVPNTLREKIKKYDLPYVSKKGIGPKIKVKIEGLSKFIEENPNLTMTEIAKHFNVEYHTIQSYIKKNNIKYNRKIKGIRNSDDDSTNSRINSILEYLKKNPKATISEISTNVHMKNDSVSYYIRRYKLKEKLLQE